MRKLFSVTTALLLYVWPEAGTAQAAPGSVMARGANDYGQANVPAVAQSGVTTIAAGDYHTRIS
jgi:hypothetical protein